MKLKDFYRWADEDENGCLVWQQYCNDKGYGIVYIPEIQTMQMKAHRVSWYLEAGHFPESGLHVAHKCDNTSCINPDHLFIATPKENVRDRISKGRTAGPRNRKLTDMQALRVRQSPLSSRKMAANLGVSHSTILEIRRGNRYG